MNNSTNFNWKPSSLSELTSIKFNMELTHLGSVASKYSAKEKYLRERIYTSTLNLKYLEACRAECHNYNEILIAVITLCPASINIFFDTYNFKI